MKVLSRRMRTGIELLIGIVLGGVFALSLSLTAFAAEIQSGDTVTIPADRTVNDDLYVFGSTISILGTVNGDVIAAGSTVTINGRVTGSVMAAANQVMVSGPVGGSVRAAGNIVSISGPVTGDVVAGASTITLARSASVGRDVLAGGAATNVLAPVARNLSTGASTLTIDSMVGGAVNARVSELTIGSNARIAGPVTYVSEKEAAISPSAVVEGAAVRMTPPEPAPNPWLIAGIDILAFIRGFVGVAALGIVALLAFPRAAMVTTTVLEQRGFASFGYGLALVAGLPVAAALIFGVGLLVGGWWIGLMLLGAYALMLVLGYVTFANWVGIVTARWARWQPHPLWSLCIGVFIVGALSLVPIVGWAIGLVAVVSGTGALAVAGWTAYRKPVAAPTALPVPAQATPVAAPA